MAKKRNKEDEHNRTTHTFNVRQTTLLEFQVVIPITVRWGDMDAFGHVNNTCYFQYFEQARMAYFQATFGAPANPPSGVGPILHSTSCRFRAPVHHPDTLQVAARVSAINEDRFTMVYRAYSHTLNRVVAEGEAIVVAFDYPGETTARLPAEWVESIEALEGRPISRDTTSAPA